LQPHVEEGTLVRVLTAWMPTFDRYHLYYLGRRHASPAFSILIEALRFRPTSSAINGAGSI
jgi:DNA-binding transcriptional LysR family regulator